MTGSDILIKQSGKTQLADTVSRVRPISHIWNFVGDDHRGNRIAFIFPTNEMQLPIREDGGNGKVAYIDNEGTLYLWKFSIVYGRAYAYEQQYNLVLGLAAKMAEMPKSLSGFC
ncbi:hypothetical protein ACP4OV_014822 [Aristida adscensionis]